MNFSLRDFLLKRVAWKRIIFMFSGTFLAYYFLTNRAYFRYIAYKTLFFFHSLFKPLSSLNNAFNGPKTELYSLCVVAMLLITLLGIIKHLRGTK